MHAQLLWKNKKIQPYLHYPEWIFFLKNGSAIHDRSTFLFFASRNRAPASSFKSRVEDFKIKHEEKIWKMLPRSRPLHDKEARMIVNRIEKTDHSNDFNNNTPTPTR